MSRFPARARLDHQGRLVYAPVVMEQSELKSHIVTVSDGTPLSCVTGGSGPPLVLVHGTGDDARRFNRVRPLLEPHFTVYALNRRGRGESGDTDDYSYGQDIEDVAAVIASFDGPVDVFAHSHGAVMALEAALRVGNLRRLMLYEPHFAGTDADPYWPTVLKVAAHMADGDQEGAVLTYLREFFKIPEEIVQRQRDHPVNWPLWLGMAHTIARELVTARAYRFKAERFTVLDLPVCLLVGGESPDHMRASVERAHQAIKGAKMVELEGQQHIAMTTAPELVASAITHFLLE
ncbi:MAG: alpha/beta hydrolase [Proteobacteria bacterium]|nr:alpha/beta hydrolase [Pseudomonadota bacterium]